MTAFATASVTAPLQLFDFHPVLADFRSAVWQGLGQTPKRIAATWLYDQRGAELFDQITALEEYYLTRTEMQILQERAVEIGDRITQGALVEFGSGSSQKIRILFDALRAKGKALPVYVGLDISKQHLQQSCEDLQRDYPELAAIAICADYTQPLGLPDVPVLRNRHKTAFFPGSTLGNLEPEDAIAFLKTVAHLIGPSGDLLIGIDLQKSKSTLEPAYDDAQGISAQFALNVLTRMNRELGANFDLAQFRYEAVYNEVAGRIEMYIVSQIAQTVEVAGEAIAFAAGERLYTEHSYKYTPAQFKQLAAQAGFKTRSVWTDAQALFMVVDLATCP